MWGGEILAREIEQSSALEGEEDTFGAAHDVLQGNLPAAILILGSQRIRVGDEA
jgi:hypothetical protein